MQDIFLLFDSIANSLLVMGTTYFLYPVFAVLIRKKVSQGLRISRERCCWFLRWNLALKVWWRDQLSGFLAHVTRSLCGVGAYSDEVIRHVLHCAVSCRAPGSRVHQSFWCISWTLDLGLSIVGHIGGGVHGLGRSTTLKVKGTSKKYMSIDPGASFNRDELLFRWSYPQRPVEVVERTGSFRLSHLTMFRCSQSCCLSLSLVVRVLRLLVVFEADTPPS